MKKIFGVLLFFTLLYDCQNQKDISHSYIAGEIINPTDKKITIFKSNVIIDTLFLDSNNRFITN